MKIILSETLKRKGKSMYWLSKTTGITQAAISKLCNGNTSRIDFDVIQKICDALECDVNEIISADNSNVIQHKSDNPSYKS